MNILRIKKYYSYLSEQLGGLSTPRLSSEIKDGDGDVLEGTTKVLNNSGNDVTEQFIKGAYETLKRTNFRCNGRWF